MICTFDDSTDNTSIGSKIEMSTVKPPNSYKWYKTNVRYFEQLVLNFSICKNTCDGDENGYFTESEIVDIQMWLCRKDFAWINFEQTGFENIYYNVFVSLERKLLGGQVIGFHVTATCDSPFGYSDVKIKTFTQSANTSFKIDTQTEEIGDIYPKVTIQMKSNCDFVLKNISTQTSTSIEGCLENEVIVMNENNQIQSTEFVRTGYDITGNHSNFLNEFNWIFPTISRTYNTTENVYMINAPCIITFEYREVRKAVI